jgi:hypothetical protein
MIRLPAGTAANKELARDLGQFTIDGGVLIIGADEGDETTPPSLTPVDLARLTERIEEVAAKPGRPPAARPHPDHRGGRPAWYGLRAVANTTDWLGSWDFGVAVTGLRGLTSFHLAAHGQEWMAAPFSENEYRETVRATYERVVKDPDGIVADLTGRLNRGLGGSAPIPQ